MAGSTRRFSLFAAFVLGGLCAPGGVAAQQETPAASVVLDTISMPPECGDQAHVEELLATELRGVELPVSATPLRVGITIDKRRRRYRLRLDTNDGGSQGKRVLRGRDCKELLRSAVVIVSLALAPDLLFRNEAPVAEASAEASSSTEKGKTGAAPSPSQIDDDELPSNPEIDALDIVRKRSRVAGGGLDWSATLGTTTTLGLLPRSAPALRAGLRARKGSQWLEMSVTRWEDQDLDIASVRPGRGARFDYLAGSLGLCQGLSLGGSELGLCGVATVGRMVAGPKVIDQPEEQSHLIPALGLELVWQQPLGERLGLVLGASGLLNLVRPRYTLDLVPDSGDPTGTMEVEVHYPSAASGGLHAALEVRFW